MKNIKTNLYEFPTPGDFDVIGLNETFLRFEWKQLPAGFSDFFPVWSPAIRVHSRGRGSGGIVMLVKKMHGDPVLLHRCENWVFIKVFIGGEMFIFGTIYFVPKVDIVPAFEVLEGLLNSFADKFPDVPIIVGGDFNAHLGSEGVIPDEFLEAVDLYKYRRAYDLLVCNRGKLLSNFMNDKNVFCMNGRSSGDTPGNITFLATTGRSTIDFIWVNSCCCLL